MTEASESNVPPTPAASATAAPSSIHLYLLAAGILAGVLLGPAVLGRLAPGTHDAWFVGGGEQAKELARERAGLEGRLRMLEGVGVTDVAREELAAQETQRLAPLQAQVQAAQAERRRAIYGWLLGALAGVMLLSVAEAVVIPEGGASARPWQHRAARAAVGARFAALAVALAVVAAQPAILRDTSWMVVAAVAAAALLWMVVPVRGRG